MPGKTGEDTLAAGQAVFTKTIGALEIARDRLREEFSEAVDLVLGCKGRVVVTGIGKSGHVARKLAATLSSTGTPAVFIHGTEAVHGDLGFVRPGDVCVIVSKSGGGDDLTTWLAVLAERECPVLALAGKVDSPLGRQASLVLDCSVSKEACPLDLAPTSSSAVALVTGDALAVALLERRDFSVDDFLRNHPAGILGRRLSLKVEDLMHDGDEIPVVVESATLREALLEIADKRLGMTAVLDSGGSLSGILTDGDIKRLLIKGDAGAILDCAVAEFASPNPRLAKCQMLATEALAVMEANAPGPITSLIVSDDGQHVDGVIHIHDIIQAGLS